VLGRRDQCMVCMCVCMCVWLCVCVAVCGCVWLCVAVQGHVFSRSLLSVCLRVAVPFIVPGIRPASRASGMSTARSTPRGSPSPAPSSPNPSMNRPASAVSDAASARLQPRQPDSQPHPRAFSRRPSFTTQLRGGVPVVTVVRNGVEVPRRNPVHPVSTSNRPPVPPLSNLPGRASSAHSRRRGSAPATDPAQGAWRPFAASRNAASAFGPMAGFATVNLHELRKIEKLNFRKLQERELAQKKRQVQTARATARSKRHAAQVDRTLQRRHQDQERVKVRCPLPRVVCGSRCDAASSRPALDALPGQAGDRTAAGGSGHGARDEARSRGTGTEAAAAAPTTAPCRQGVLQGIRGQPEPCGTTLGSR